MDKREAVLQRLETVAKTVPGIKTVVRNRELIEDEQQPAIQILDGDEVAYQADPSGRANSRPPRRVAMTPEIFVSLGEDPEDVGPTLNGFVAKLKKAIELDTVPGGLWEILGSNGDVRYEACVTDLSRQPQRFMQAECGIQYSFHYVHRPETL